MAIICMQDNFEGLIMKTEPRNLAKWALTCYCTAALDVIFGHVKKFCNPY
jgi:hypothetical protein